MRHTDMRPLAIVGRPAATAGLSVVVALAACTSSSPQRESSVRLSASAPVQSPTAVVLSRSVADVAGDAQPYPGRPWQRDGAIVRQDVVGASTGPDHCGWESAVFLTVGLPLGTGSRTSNHTRTYVRDPDRVVPGQRRTLATSAALPSSAHATGYRLDGVELWLGADQTQFAYLVGSVGTDVERWPVWSGPGCA